MSAESGSWWPRLARAALDTVLSQGKQGALCLTVGGLCAAVGVFRGVDTGKLWILLFSGMAFALLPARYIYSADRQARALERKWRHMLDRGQLPLEVYAAMIRELETQRHALEMQEAFGAPVAVEPKSGAKEEAEDDASTD